MKYIHTLLLGFGALVLAHTVHLNGTAEAPMSYLAAGLEQIKQEQTKKIEELFSAIEKQNSQKVQQLLNEGLSPHTQQKDGVPAIAKALEQLTKDQHSEVAFLLAQRVNYQNLEEKYWNQLFGKMQHLNDEQRKTLITSNPPEEPNKIFQKLLKNNHTKAAEALARFHPNIQLKQPADQEQETLFDKAIDYATKLTKKKRTEEARAFITNILSEENNEDLLGTSGDYPTKLHQLIANDKKVRAETLARYAPFETPEAQPKTSNLINLQDSQNNTPLHLAIKNNLRNVATTLLKNHREKIDFTTADSKGNTLLRTAIDNNQDEVIAEILRAGKFSLNEAEMADLEYLYTIAKNEQMKDMMGVLLGRRAGDDNNTLLHQAIIDKETKKATEYIDQLPEGPDEENNRHPVNAKNKNGDTPLHLALRNKQHQVVDKLLELTQLDPNIANNKHETPLSIIAEQLEQNDTEKLRNIAQNLITHQKFKAQQNTTALTKLQNLAVANDIQELWIACAKAQQIDVTTAQGQQKDTLLHQKIQNIEQASQADREQEIRKAIFLIDYINQTHQETPWNKTNHPFNLQNTDGNTPLHLAITKDYPQIFTELTKDESIQNINLTLKNNNKKTPIDIALEDPQKDQKGFAVPLLSSVAKTQQITAEMISPDNLLTAYESLQKQIQNIEQSAKTAQLSEPQQQNKNDYENAATQIASLQGKENNTILHMAIKQRETDTAERIIKKHGNAMVKVNTENILLKNAPNNAGKTPLHLLVENKDYGYDATQKKIVNNSVFARLVNDEKLIKNSAWKKTKKDGSTVLHLLVNNMIAKSKKKEDLAAEEKALTLLLDTANKIDQLPEELKKEIQQQKKGLTAKLGQVFSQTPSFKKALLLQKNTQKKTPYATANNANLPPNVLNQLNPQKVK